MKTHHAQYPNSLEKLDSLCRQVRADSGQPGHITTGPRKARRDTTADHVRAQRTHNRNAISHSTRSPHNTGPVRQDQVNLRRDQIPHKVFDAVWFQISPPILDQEIPAFDVSEISQASLEGIETDGWSINSRRRIKIDTAHSRYPRCLLRVCSERPAERQERAIKESPPIHSIT